MAVSGQIARFNISFIFVFFVQKTLLCKRRAINKSQDLSKLKTAIRGKTVEGSSRATSHCSAARDARKQEAHPIPLSSHSPRFLSWPSR